MGARSARLCVPLTGEDRPRSSAGPAKGGVPPLSSIWKRSPDSQPTLSTRWLRLARCVPLILRSAVETCSQPSSTSSEPLSLTRPFLVSKACQRTGDGLHGVIAKGICRGALEDIACPPFPNTVTQE